MKIAVFSVVVVDEVHEGSVGGDVTDVSLTSRGDVTCDVTVVTSDVTVWSLGKSLGVAEASLKSAGLGGGVLISLGERISLFSCDFRLDKSPCVTPSTSCSDFLLCSSVIPGLLTLTSVVVVVWSGLPLSEDILVVSVMVLDSPGAPSTVVVVDVSERTRLSIV
uniref:Uncharacterized protein n=1 Tax=Cacopsylla melanoneura TaxID=428564 RepID=A0A8D9B130_9HEMI